MIKAMTKDCALGALKAGKKISIWCIGTESTTNYKAFKKCDGGADEKQLINREEVNEVF
jgi:hypothetical protein